ncbi:uncharacterized protein ALTATR162_LOCUS7596 [Alternaria atra]|uniref:Uncharacterized protein n=1 Tax=Alternaria atra TaxID=119953 RepID=A0A8J2N879_9PLEO|nr:uncharacterized protein ALTATR162_LOCUS7596 [Alternaria atra]CAG5173214.1 unnamed protein product [Alternaria atra]
MGSPLLMSSKFSSCYETLKSLPGTMASTSKSHVDREAITVGDIHESHLLRLPGEIKNVIHHYALEGEVHIRTYSIHHHDTHNRKNRLTLPASCRQIQLEIVLLPYQFLTIRFARWKFRAFCLTLSSRKCQAIRKIHMEGVEKD